MLANGVMMLFVSITVLLSYFIQAYKINFFYKRKKGAKHMSEKRDFTSYLNFRWQFQDLYFINYFAITQMYLILYIMPYLEK